MRIWVAVAGTTKPRRVLRGGLVVCVVVGVVVGGAQAEPESSSHAALALSGTPVIPRTLLQLRVPIAKFAQDGARLAWMTGRCRDPGRDNVHVGNDTVAVRTLGEGTVTLTGRACQPNGSYPEAVSGNGRLQLAGLALAGKRALFWHPYYYGGTGYVAIVMRTAALDDRRVREVTLKPFGPLHHGSGAEGGTFATGLDGDGAGLALAVAKVNTRADDNGCYCRYSVTGGGTFAIRGARATPLPGAPVPAFMDIANGRVALVPAAPTFSTLSIPARTPARVEIRQAASGAVETEFAVRGAVRALALSADSVAVLVNKNGRTRIDRFDARTGAHRATVLVPRSTGEVDIDRNLLVYASGSEIHIIGQSTRLHVRASGRPVGLSIEGRRVAWAENVRGRGRIRAVLVP